MLYKGSTIFHAEFRIKTIMAHNSGPGEKGRKRRGGLSCVVATPNNQSCTNTQYTPNISLHSFPSIGLVRKQWISFVRRHHKGNNNTLWGPSSTSRLFSAHFKDSCYNANRHITKQLGMIQMLNSEAISTIDIAALEESLKRFNLPTAS